MHRHSLHGRLHRAPKPVRLAIMAVGGLVFGAVFFVGLGWVTMAVWNAVIPAISSLPALTFWQAVGIFVLCRLLVGRFGGGGRMRRQGRDHWHSHRLGDYEDWWSTEGEAVFRDYLRRHKAAGDDAFHAG